MNLYTDSLWIGALIKDRLEGIVPVYPCVASEGSPETFCVYRRAGYQGRNTKDRFNYDETINIVLSVVAKSYIGSLEIAQRIKDRMDGRSGVWKDKKIDSMTMTNAVEDFQDDAYVQHLYFSIVLDTTFGR